MEYGNFQKLISQTLLLTEDRKSYFIARGKLYSPEIRKKMADHLVKHEKEFMTFTKDFQNKREVIIRKQTADYLHALEMHDVADRAHAEEELEVSLSRI